MGQPVGSGEPHIVNVPRNVGTKGENMRTRIRTSARFAAVAVALAFVAAACGSDGDVQRRHDSRRRHRQPPVRPPGTTGAAATTGRSSGCRASSSPSTRGPVRPSTPTSPRSCSSPSSAHRSSSSRSTRTRRGSGLDAGDLDANLEIWPSGHAADYKTYIDEKKTVVDIGLLGPSAKIGWYVPTFVIDQHPELTTWEGFKDPELAKLFATAESGDLGQFLMGDPSYVTYDEQIIKNLDLPLKYVVAGSEAALITAIQQAETDQKPLLLQFWQPHWLQSKVKLTEVEAARRHRRLHWRRPRPPMASTPATIRPTRCTRRPTPGSRRRTRRRSTSSRSSS